MKNKTALFFLLFVLIASSCTKRNEDYSVVEIDENNLTACPANTTCNYLFAENKFVDPNGGIYSLTAGKYRVFWVSLVKNGVQTLVYIRASMNKDSFSLGKKDFLNGDVQYVTICSVCFSIPVSPIDGYVKGVNLTPGKSAGDAKWILEGKIMLTSTADVNYKDSIILKQYFYPGVSVNSN